MNNNLNVLQQFENVLKKCLIEYFGTYLNANKLAKLNNSSYIDTQSLSALNSRENIQGFILRGMLHDIINISYINPEDNKVYGKELEDIVIEYYANAISTIYKFDIDKKSVDNQNIMPKLKEKFGDNFHNILINSNIIKINSILNNNNTEKVINEYISNDGSIQIIENSTGKFIKYTNKNNEQQLNKINNNTVEIYFNDRLNNLVENAQLSAEIFYTELLGLLDNKDVILNTNINSNIAEKDIKEEIETSNNTLTPAKYEELCIKYASGERLTQEEMTMLMNSSPELAESVINSEQQLNTEQKHTLGKITNSLLFYILEIGTLFIILIILLINR